MTADQSSQRSIMGLPIRPSVQAALAAVMADVQAVHKSDQNKAQGFSFRGIDSVVNAVGPAFRTHGVVPVPIVQSVTYDQVEVGTKGARMTSCRMTVAWRFYGPGGDHIEAVTAAEAFDSGDKATAKAHSVAYRTCLLQLLCIPTDEPDPDSHSYELAPTPVAEPSIGEKDVARIVALMQAAPDPAAVKATWKARFGVWPAALPVSRLAEADDWLSDLETPITEARNGG